MHLQDSSDSRPRARELTTSRAGHYAFHVFSMVIGLLRILFVLLLVRLLARFVVAALRGYLGAPGERREAPSHRPAAVDLVRDRVCNTFVDRERALTGQVDGQRAYFCSAACRDRSSVLALSR